VPSGNTSSAIACLLFCHHKDHNSVLISISHTVFQTSISEIHQMFHSLQAITSPSWNFQMSSSLQFLAYLSFSFPQRWKMWRPVFIEISVGKNTLSLCRYQVGGDHPFHPRPWTTKLYCLWKKIPSKCRLNLIP
jgi:hypothetical protein